MRLLPKLKLAGIFFIATCCLIRFGESEIQKSLPHDSLPRNARGDITPELTGFVNDFARLYTPTYVTSLEEKLDRLSIEQNLRVAVVTVPTLENNTVERVASHFLHSWKINRAIQNKEVVLLIALQERKIRIATGERARSLLSDEQCRQIISNKIAPFLSEGRYEQGTTAGLQAIEAACKPTPNRFQEIISAIFFGVFLVVIISPIFRKMIAKNKAWWIFGIVGFLSSVFFETLLVSICSGLCAALFGKYWVTSNLFLLAADGGDSGDSGGGDGGGSGDF